MTNSRLHPAVAIALLLLALVLALPDTGALAEAAVMIKFVVGLYYR